MNSYEIIEKIDPRKGEGIIFKERYTGRNCITLARNEYGLYVGGRVTTFLGSLDAEHFYATLRVSPLMYRYTDEKTGHMTSTCQPEESEGFRIDVCYPAKHDIYSKYIGENLLEVKKGMPTSRFDSVEEAIEAIEVEFNRLFGEPWVLKPDCIDQSWEDYKKEMFEDYSSKKRK